MSGSWLAHGLGGFVIGWLWRNARASRATVSGNNLISTGSRATHWVLGFCTLVLLGLAALTYLIPGAPAWVSGFFIALVVLAYLGWPRTIILDSEGISQRSYFGGWKKIPWRSVIAVVNRQRDSATFVRGSDGTRILFSPYQVDQDRFHAEVLKRSGRPHLD